MIKEFSKIKEFLSGTDPYENNKLIDVTKKYNFYNISKNSALAESEKEEIYQNISDSKIVIIDRNEELNELIEPENLIIIGIENTIIILDLSSLLFLQNLLSYNSSISVYFLTNQNDFLKNINVPSFNADEIFLKEIQNFKEKMKLNHKSGKIMKKIWNFILPCISGYLIKKSYLKRANNRIQQYIFDLEKNLPSIIIQKDEYIKLRDIGIGGAFRCELIYYIKNGDLYVLKIPNSNDEENDKLIQREALNYSKIKHPLLPKFYGYIKNENYIIIEFINGSTLNDIDSNKFTYNNIVTIIFELMIVLDYLHNKNLIYRDLKPNNIMIDENKNIVLIDFDRLIEKFSKDEHTLDLQTSFSDPLICKTKKFSSENDIYSLGKVIEYLMNQSDNFKSNQLEEIYKKCTNEILKDRPSSSDLLKKFTSKFQNKIQIEKVCSNFEDHYKNFRIINKASENLTQKDAISLFSIGSIYHHGIYVDINIKKAIDFYSSAAEQNLSQAQLFWFTSSFYDGFGSDLF